MALDREGFEPTVYTMVLDTSAIVAIIFREPGAGDLVDRVTAATAVGVGAPTVVESAMLLSGRLKRDARPLLERFLTEVGAQIIPFRIEHYSAAIQAFLRYGKGRHAASLNFGDCLSYAVAKVAGQPLLFVGEDFPRTDVQRA